MFISPKKQRAKSYCSEFIANVYKDIGINIKDKKLYPIWPIHIYELLTKDEWLNVTEEYKDYFGFYKNLHNGIDDFNEISYALLFKKFHNIACNICHGILRSLPFRIPICQKFW